MYSAGLATSDQGIRVVSNSAVKFSHGFTFVHQRFAFTLITSVGGVKDKVTKWVRSVSRSRALAKNVSFHLWQEIVLANKVRL
jgi:hypothetical protein